MHRTIVLAVAATLLVIVAATAASGGTEAGLNEVNGSALFAMQLGEGVDNSEWAIGFEGNRFLVDSYSIGARLAMAGMSDGDTDIFLLALYLKSTGYFAASESVAPYIGAGVGLQYAKVTYHYDDYYWRRGSVSVDDTEPGLTVYLGVKVFPAHNVALSFETRFDALFEYMDNGTLGEYVGLSYFF